MAEAGIDLWRSPSPASLLRQEVPAAEYHTQALLHC